MEEYEFFWRIGVVILGATGLWKVVEVLIQYRLDRRLRKAEMKHINAATEAQLMDNWIQWSQHLEQRVKELEQVSEENKRLKEQIEAQRDRINQLESKVTSLEKENAGLKRALSNLKHNKK